MHHPSADPDYFEALCELYERQLRLLDNESCMRCDAKLKNPLAAWHVGRLYRQSPMRIVFVGKPHRGIPGIVRPSGVVDPRELVERRLRRSTWPYWSYTNAIANLVFGDTDSGWERIALTNLVKCTNVASEDSSQDTTSKTMVSCCVSELGVLPSELLVLRPTHVVFYTARFFPSVLEALELPPAVRWRDIVRTTRQCGRKQLPWWEREAETTWTPALRILITGHPERMHRSSFTSLVAEWLTRTRVTLASEHGG